MINYFYSMEIADRIKSILDAEVPAAVKNISVGDLTLLPAPQNIIDYVPAIFITPWHVDTDFANESLGVGNDLYPYSIYYLAPFSFEPGESVRAKYKDAELIANIIRNHRNLDNYVIAKSDTEAGGQVLQVAIDTIRYETDVTKLFFEADVPACMIEVMVGIAFRTFSR